MSNRGYISRYLPLIKKLKAKPYSTYKELDGYIDKLNIGFSKWTFQRDLRDIRDTFSVFIEYSRKAKGYFISKNEITATNYRKMLVAFGFTRTDDIKFTDNWVCRECLHVFDVDRTIAHESLSEFFEKTKCPHCGSGHFLINGFVQLAVEIGKSELQLLEVEREFKIMYPGPKEHL